MIHHAKDIYAIIVLAFLVLLVSGGFLYLNSHSAAPAALACSGVMALLAFGWRVWFAQEIKE